MGNSQSWKVVTATVEELEKNLNELARAGFEVFSVLQVGASEPMSNVPRDHKSLEQRTTFAIVAHRNSVSGTSR